MTPTNVSVFFANPSENIIHADVICIRQLDDLQTGNTLFVSSLDWMLQFGQVGVFSVLSGRRNSENVDAVPSS